MTYNISRFLQISKYHPQWITESNENIFLSILLIMNIILYPEIAVLKICINKR